MYKDTKNFIDFNFEKFCNLLGKEREIIDIFYYNATLDIRKDPEKYKSQQRFFDKLKKISNLNLILCKLIKRKTKEAQEYYYVLKEDDIHMAVDMVEGAADNKFDIAIIISGDGDFVPAVKAIQRKNKKVENAYFSRTASSYLKQTCDKSIKLTKQLLDKCFDN